MYYEDLMDRCEAEEEQHFQAFLAERTKAERLQQRIALLEQTPQSAPAAHALGGPRALRVVRRSDDAGSTRLRAAPEESSDFAMDEIDGEVTDVTDGTTVAVLSVVGERSCDPQK